MREIKFRGKRVDNGEWTYGDLFEERGYCYIIKHPIEYTNESGSQCTIKVFSYEVIPETVGQYTGLKDKNGVEIYEGDVVKIHSHRFDTGFYKEKVGQIKYMDGTFGFYKKDEHNMTFNPLVSEIEFEIFEHYEVIGTRYMIRS